MRVDFRVEWGYSYLYTDETYHPTYIWDGNIDCSNGEIDEIYQLKANDVAGAQKDYLATNAILEVLFKYGNLQSVMRAAMSFMGIDAGYNPAPFTEMDASRLPELKEELKALRDKLQIEDVDILGAVK